MCAGDENRKLGEFGLDCTRWINPVAALVVVVVPAAAAAAPVRDVFSLIQASMSLKALLVIIQ